MPNWCDNYMSFVGDEEKLKKVEAFCQGMDFNKICPMPERLNIQRGTISNIAKKIYKGEELDDSDIHHLNRFPVIGECSEKKPYGECSADLSYLWIQKKIEGEPTRKKVYEADRAQEPKSRGDLYELGRIISENGKTHGSEDWFDWRYDNWGTKWNASRVYIEKSGNSLEYSFETPNGAPDGIIDLIAKYVFKLSGVEMSGSYSIEMCGSGTYELTKEGIKEILWYEDYGMDENDDMVLSSISMELFADREEYISIPDDIDEENVLRKNFKNKEEMIAYLSKLNLNNNEFRDRLVKYAREFDITSASADYYGNKDITDVEPCEYRFSITTQYTYKSELSSSDDTGSVASSKYSSFEELLADVDKE